MPAELVVRFPLECLPSSQIYFARVLPSPTLALTYVMSGLQGWQQPEECASFLAASGLHFPLKYSHSQCLCCGYLLLGQDEKPSSPLVHGLALLC